MNSNRLKACILGFITVILWASAFPLTKMIGDDIAPNPLATIRIVVAMLIMLIIALPGKVRKPFSKADTGLFVLMGATGFTLYYVFINMGLLTLTSTTISLLAATCPILTTVLAMKFYSEKVNPLGWIGTAIAFAGVAILVLGQGVLSLGIGIIWGIAAPASFAVYNILNRKMAAKGYTSKEIVLYSTIFATILLIPFFPSTVAEMTTCGSTALILAVILGIFQTALALVFWAKALEITDNTSSVTNINFFLPLFTAIFAILLISEQLTVSTVVGGLVIIAGVVMFELKR